MPEDKDLTLQKEEAVLALLKLMNPNSTDVDRWNVEVHGDTIQYCMGYHDKGEGCDYFTLDIIRKDAEQYLHNKRKSVYDILGVGHLQIEEGTTLEDGDSLIFYIGVEGDLWARKPTEFHDGRFTKVNADPLVVRIARVIDADYDELVGDAKKIVHEKASFILSNIAHESASPASAMTDEALEQRSFASCLNRDIPELARQLITDLWRAYCRKDNTALVNTGTSGDTTPLMYHGVPPSLGSVQSTAGMSEELQVALKEAKARLDAMSPEEKEAMFEIQKKNYAKDGPFGPTDGMGTVVYPAPAAPKSIDVSAERVGADFYPTKYYKTELEDGRSVSVLTDGSQVGLQFINKLGDRTRALLSHEAAVALGSGVNAILAGGGQPIEKKWVHVLEHTLVRKENHDQPPS